MTEEHRSGADGTYSKGDPKTYFKLDDLEKDRISRASTERLEYVIRSLDEADKLSRDLVWQSELWDNCTVEELLGALIEAENLLEERQERTI